MTPEVIVHHPIPEDLTALLEDLGYVPVLETSSYTRFERVISMSDRNRAQRKRSARMLPANHVLYTPEQAAELLGVGRTTVYKLINAGELRSVTIGRCRRIGAAELERFVAALDRSNSRLVG